MLIEALEYAVSNREKILSSIALEEHQSALKRAKELWVNYDPVGDNSDPGHRGEQGGRGGHLEGGPQGEDLRADSSLVAWLPCEVQSCRRQVHRISD